MVQWETVSNAVVCSHCLNCLTTGVVFLVFFLKICELLLIMPRVAKVCYEHHIYSFSYFWVYRSCVMVVWYDLPSLFLILLFENVFEKLNSLKVDYSLGSTYYFG